jgi:hypothetical protein
MNRKNKDDKDCEVLIEEAGNIWDEIQIVADKEVLREKANE